MERDINKQLELIGRGAVEIIQRDELKKKLERAVKTNKPLVIKAGFDPTAPDIHLGHTVLLRKLRHFQDLGHKVIFLIGDATALVGDPSGQSQTRKTLARDEVEKNAKTYEKQVSKILDTSNPHLFERKHNSSWFSKPHFSFDEFVELAQRYTIARILERDDFEKRMHENKPISFLETFYPLMQGYDSVKLQSDIEIGGSDQKFNMLVGRDLQQAYGQEAQIVLTMPILEGLDGVQKMSKSLGNYVGINEPAKDMFGKLMSVSDELMYKYYELLTDEDVAKIKSDVASGALHPKAAKVRLAKIIVTQYHSKAEANKQAEEFDRAFKDKGFPEDIPLVDVSNIKMWHEAPKDEKDFTTPLTKKGPYFVSVIDLISEATKLVGSRGEAKRKIQEGAVEINGIKITNINGTVVVNTNNEYKIRVGRKFAKIHLKL